MTGARLLAVVEVPKEDRVQCQAPGCNHPVFRRIHMVRQDGVLRVLGSECFKKLFGESSIATSTPRYGTSDGRRLTDEERTLLAENTERLIEQFEAEHQAALSRMAAAELARTRTKPPLPTLPVAPVQTAPQARPTREEVQAAEAQAKEYVRVRYRVDPDLPGWRGLVLLRMRELLGPNAV